MTLRSRGLLFDDPPPLNLYPCRGAYVSEECGSINWEKFNEKYISFVYIRAGKGISFTDKQLEDNLKGALKSGLPFGFVFDLSFSADGLRQADAFLEATGDMTGRLAPVIDIRMSLIERLLYNDKRRTLKILSELRTALKRRCGCDPVIMTDERSYSELAEAVKGCPILGVDDDVSAFGGEWYMLAYSPDGRSEGLEDITKRYTMMTAYKGCTLDKLCADLTVSNK
ncbi:MAG: hypothetical protein IKP47_09740 [Ruminococcus sp.]|nr:hypothetical protein [Ruminococcus sp.]